ncbi:MAG: hypothetical protein C5B49_14860 [Bdellovibrio sp.]|nr:MAG: hypothetical protein C5B49_14860 [Bdellovibrio sp.]
MNFRQALRRALRCALGPWALILCCGVGAADEAGRPNKSNEKSETIRVRETGVDFYLPSKLWDLLLPADVTETAKKAVEADDEELIGSSLQFAPLTVILEEKSKGVLTSPRLSFVFKEGGGLIDLAKWTTGKSGTFSVSFSFDGALTALQFHAFFLSEARKRKIEEIDGNIVGSGCRSYFDITSAILGAGKNIELKVNTTGQMASTTLGGHFIFSWQREADWYVTQVQFTDSLHPSLYCSAAEAARGI